MSSGARTISSSPRPGRAPSCSRTAKHRQTAGGGLFQVRAVLGPSLEFPDIIRQSGLVDRPQRDLTGRGIGQREFRLYTFQQNAHR